MTEFDESVATTPKTALPLLFSGQTQHEFFINHALSVLDSLIVETVRGWAIEGPDDSADGDAYLVPPSVDGAWKAHANKRAIRVGGDWHFVEPENGQRVFDQSASVMLFFDASWKAAKTPSVPTGGETVDSQARTAIQELVAALRTAGILAK